MSALNLIIVRVLYFLASSDPFKGHPTSNLPGRHRRIEARLGRKPSKLPTGQPPRGSSLFSCYSRSPLAPASAPSPPNASSSSASSSSSGRAATDATTTKTSATQTLITLVDDKSLDGSIIHISDTTLDLSQPVSVSFGGLQLEAKSSIPVAAESKPLNPLVAPFFPPTHVVKTKNNWNPPRPLFFQWARGGCPTRITPPLDASASVYVPKNRAAVSVVEGPCGQHTIPAKKAIIFRRAPPSFWSPGGRAIPIVPPIDA
ncbi:hypothetical protein C8R46DRAFT_1229087 [Mycena filopes]|nr:hypothetical protein C8R46DRAFT_1229087 [Mycena filopes]